VAHDLVRGLDTLRGPAGAADRRRALFSRAAGLTSSKPQLTSYSLPPVNVTVARGALAWLGGARALLRSTMANSWPFARRSSEPALEQSWRAALSTVSANASS